MIEILWSKERILETYLNVAKIAASLPNPKLYTVKPISKKVLNRYDDIMIQMNNLEGDDDIKKLIK